MVEMLGPAAIVIEKASDATPPRLSVTLTVKLDRPAVVGVPVIAPPALSERPAGRDPLVTAQV